MKLSLVAYFNDSCKAVFRHSPFLRNSFLPLLSLEMSSAVYLGMISSITSGGGVDIAAL